jgi:exo-beta-1,3-glucanase (GH17 family)
LVYLAANLGVIMAFNATGLTVSVTAAVTVPTSAQAVSTAPTTRPARTYRVANFGSELVLLGVGADDTAAKAAAASLAAGAIPLLPNTVSIIGFPAGSYFTGKTAANTSVVYVTPGEET